MTPTPFFLVTSKRLGQWIAFSGLGVIVVMIWYFWTYNMLMRDAEMLAHFKAHRADMEYLVKHHRSFDPTKPPYVWHVPKEARAAKERAGVRSVSNIGPLWLPEPYTEKTVYLIDSLIQQRRFDVLNTRRVGSTAISLNKRRDSNSLLHMYPWIWKEYVHIPVVPKIEGDKLLEPWGLSRSLEGKPPNQYVKETIYKNSYRVLDSLNGYPPDWKRGECVYRRIEAQWFLRMCRAAM